MIKIFRSEDILQAYSFDASRNFEKPYGVVFPSNTEEVAEILYFCYNKGFRVTPRGGGSGLVGGAVPEEDGIVVSLEKMKNFSFSPPYVVAESGAISGEIERFISKMGFFLPFQPSSMSFSTVGGNVSTDAAGLRSVKYLSAKYYVEEIECVLPRGEIVNLRNDNQLFFVIPGSEGTLCIITKVKLRALPIPKRKLRVISGDLEMISEEIKLILRSFLPSALEILDIVSSKIVGLPPLYHIILEIDDDSDWRGESCDERIWILRKKLGPAMAKIKPFKFNEDVVVPISKIREFLKFCEDEEIVVFGHAGIGIFHANIVFSPGEEKLAEMKREKLFDFISSIDGAITGEHGIGLSKRRFMKIDIDEKTIMEFINIKRRIDDRFILNPSKMDLMKIYQRGCIDTEL